MKAAFHSNLSIFLLSDLMNTLIKSFGLKQLKSNPITIAFCENVSTFDKSLVWLLIQIFKIFVDSSLQLLINRFMVQIFLNIKDLLLESFILSVLFNQNISDSINAISKDTTRKKCHKNDINPFNHIDRNNITVSHGDHCHNCKIHWNYILIEPKFIL